MAATRVQSVPNQSATSTSIPVTSTQGWVAPTVGNLLVAWYGGDNTCTSPTGWTAGPSVVDNDAVYFWWKIAVAGDSAGVTFTQAGASPGTAGLIEYSGVTTPHETPGGSATSNGVGFTSSIGTMTQVGTGTSGDLFIALANAHSWPSTSPPSAPVWTNSFANFVNISSVTSSAQFASATFIADFQNAAAATVSTTCSWSTSTANDRSGLLIAFQLAAGAAPAALPMLASYVGPG